MFKKNKKFSFSNLKDKFLHRANLLYSDMKDKFKVSHEEKENTLSLLNKTQEELENKLKKEEINKSNNLKNDNSSFTDEERKKAREFITNGEGFSEKAYQDTGGVWTIGYGHTKNVKKGDKITLEEAEKYYKADFEEHIEPLKEVKVPLNNNQKIALASLIYNIGPNAFRKSTLLKKLNNNDFDGAADEFDKWTYDNGKKLNGLVNRRKKEKELFISPDK